MAQALRELLLSLKIQVDKTGIAQTEKAFDSAANSAKFFENGAYKALEPLKKIGAQLDTNTRKARAAFKEVFGSTGFALPTRAPEAPSTRKARELREALGMQNFAKDGVSPTPPRPGEFAGKLTSPNVDDFLDKRSGPAKAIDAVREAAGRASATVNGFASRFNEKFDRVTGAIFNARTALAGFVVVTAGAALYNFVNGVVQAGSELHTMAQRTRMSVETLQVWRQVAAGVNADAPAVTGAFQKLSRAVSAAGKGGKAQVAAFRELGVEFKGRELEDVLIDTGSALAALDDDAKASALGIQLLGPAGAALVPAFKDGAAAVRKLTAEFRENVAMNAEEAARLEEVGSAVERGTKKWTALKTRAIVLLLPLLETLASAFERGSKWILRMAKETASLQTILVALGGFGLTRVVSGLIAWTAKAGGARAALVLLGQSLSSAAGFALRFLAPLLVIEDFLVFLMGGKSLFGRAFEEMFGEGGAKEARKSFLEFFEKVKKVLVEDVLPVIRDIADNPFVKGAFTVAGETLLGVLNLLGIAFTDDTKKIDELGDRFFANTARMSNAIDGVIAKLKELFGMQSDTPSFAGPEMSPQSRELAQKSPWFADTPKPSYAEQFGFKPVVPVPTSPTAPGTASKSVNLTDNRKIEVNVGSNQTAGSTGRAVAGAVEAELTKDRRQVMNAL